MEFDGLVGMTLTEVVVGDDTVRFVSDLGTGRLYHEQDCCESVWVEDVAGDVLDLVGSPVLIAEESTSDEQPEGWKEDDVHYLDSSSTWTFYRVATAKGLVVIRFCGTSNGYYSEAVSWKWTKARKLPPEPAIVPVRQCARLIELED